MTMAIIKRIVPPHTTEEMYRKQIAMQQKYIDFLLEK